VWTVECDRDEAGGGGKAGKEESRRRGSTMNMCFSSISAALNHVEDLSFLLSLTLFSYTCLSMNLNSIHVPLYLKLLRVENHLWE
jgi:hypothetical protein